VVLWVVIVAILAGGGWIAFTSWPGRQNVAAPSPSPVSSPADSGPADSSQIEGMNALLQKIKATRSEVPDTLGSCASLDSDLSALQQAVQERRDETTEAANLPIDQLLDGTQLSQALVDLTQRTLDADQQYLNWAQDAQASGQCTDAGEDTGISDANQRAADAKRAFVDLWNSDAAEFQLPQYAWNDF
jgi:hypothetical protein